MIGGASAVQRQVARKTGIKGPIAAVKDVARTKKVTAKHGKYAAGWLGTRGVIAAGAPMAAIGAKNLLTTKPKPVDRLNVKEDVFNESAYRTVGRTSPKTRQRKFDEAVALTAGTAGGGAAGGALGARYAPAKFKLLGAAGGTAVGATGGAMAAAPVARRIARSREKTPLSKVAKEAHPDPHVEHQLMMMMHQERKRLKSQGHKIRDLPNGDFIAKPPKRRKIKSGSVRQTPIGPVQMFGSYDDYVAHRDKVSKLAPDDAAINTLARREQKALINRKRKQSTYSLASAGLGATALGLKAPALAGVIVRRAPKSPKAVHRFAGVAPRADKMATNVGIGSLGVGSVGSLNFARIQRSETKADQRSANALKQVSKRVLVTGSRDWDDRDAVHAQLDRLHREHGNVEVIEGGATGADTHAREWATAKGRPLKTYKADWKKHGRSAGPRRNQQMLDEAKPERVIAFSRDLESSRGTKDMVRRARKAGVPVEVYGGKVKKMHLSGNRERSEDVAKAMLRFRPPAIRPPKFGGVKSGGVRWYTNPMTGIHRQVAFRGSMG